jgi:hypothetical protein
MKKGAFKRLFCVSSDQDWNDQRPAGIPVGCMYPSRQAIKTQMKSRIENPTRNAKAFAMLFAFVFPACLSFSPPLSMKNMAAPKLPKIAINPMIARYVMTEIIA